MLRSLSLLLAPWHECPTGLAKMIALRGATTPRFARKARLVADVVNIYFHCPACAAGWSEDGGGFCEAPVEFETKCATSYNFAEAHLPTASRTSAVYLARWQMDLKTKEELGAPRHGSSRFCGMCRSLLGQRRLVASIGNARPVASRISGLQACFFVWFFV